MFFTVSSSLIHLPPNNVSNAHRYTGLLGFIDAFVLRNILQDHSRTLVEQCDAVDATDAHLLSTLSLPLMPAPDKPKVSPLCLMLVMLAFSLGCP